MANTFFVFTHILHQYIKLTKYTHRYNLSIHNPLNTSNYRFDARCEYIDYHHHRIINIMTQATGTDITELKNLIVGISTEIKSVRDLVIDLDKKVTVLDTRLVEVEKKIDKQDTRLWAFVGILFTITFGGLTTLVVRYLAFSIPTP